MKKAFTMIELVFVIVVIGILLAIIIPRIHTDKLNEAGVQVLGHIRYTQHLAMIDDKYDPNDSSWFQRRWRIAFHKGIGTNNQWSYTVFADVLGTASGNPEPSEIAINPLNQDKRLTGGFSSSSPTLINTGDPEATEEMNLGIKYGILDIKLSSACSTGQTIGFDHLGRPLRGTLKDFGASYTTNSLVSNGCVVRICSVANCDSATADEKIEIAIEAETGYAHIL